MDSDNNNNAPKDLNFAEGSEGIYIFWIYIQIICKIIFETLNQLRVKFPHINDLMISNLNVL